MLYIVDGELTESENWNFLKNGRIGKHPMQSLYKVLPYLVIICSSMFVIVAFLTVLYTPLYIYTPSILLST